jgi:CRISPR-associated protein Cmr1
MTTVYGGGAETGRNDGFDPYRVPSIRGQLRFWWRASRGASFSTPDKLRQEENAIWGDTDRVSPVRLRILNFKAGVERPAAQRGAEGRWTDEQPKYVLFPAQENRKEIGPVYRGGSFRLEVRAPERLVADVDGALWAWFTFGGIGGRTRRGCGALYCNAYAHSWKSESLKGDGTPRDWPVLRGGTAVMGTGKSDWFSCWKSCIDVLQTFRQDRPHPRGRSRWPEPDEIRRIRGVHPPQHAPVNPLHEFPRAALGLPIIFQFKSSEDPEPNTLNVIDDQDMELRMASPVILKPWAVSATEAIPLLISLNTKPMAEQLQSLPGTRLVLKQKQDLHQVEPPGREAIDRLISLAAKTWSGQVYPL